MRPQWMPAQERRARQLALLREILCYAHAHSPFHKARLDAIGLMPARIRLPDGLLRLPLVTKDYIHGAGDRLMSDEFRKRDLHETRTGARREPRSLARVRAGARLVPVTAGIVVLACNVPGLTAPLRLSREAYAGIFTGSIRLWNDARIRAANPGLALPNRSIALVARQDGSGTTFALTNHLSAVSPLWRDRGPGTGTLVDWHGLAMLARGNEGVAALIKRSDYSLGYVEYHFAKRLGLAMARLENRAGRYVDSGERGGQAALAASVKDMPDNLRLFMPDPGGEDSYPIVTFSWLLLYGHYADGEKAAALRKFVAWG